MTSTAPLAHAKRAAYIQYIKSNLLLEWRCLCQPKMYLCILLGALAQFFHNAAHNFVYYLAGVYGVYGGPANQLVDLGFLALSPSIANLSFLPSNGCLYSVAIIAVGVACSPTFTTVFVGNANVRSLHMLWRGLMVCSMSIILRVVSFLLTILPAPAPQCAEGEFDPPKTASEIFFKFDTEKGCSDLIFSSHMMYGITACGIVTHYLVQGMKRDDVTVRERWCKYALIALCVSLVISEGFCIVAQNRHYTVDVWTAAYAVPLVWIAFFHFVPNDPSPVPAVAPILKRGIEDESDESPETATV